MKSYIQFLVFALCFMVVSLLYFSSSVHYYAGLFLPFNEWIDTLILILITSYFLYVLFMMFSTKKIAKYNIIIFFSLYTLFTVYTLFMPRRGSTGINLNPLNLFFTPQDPLIIILNFLLFVPIGFILRLNWRNLLGVALGITIIELTQYITGVGYCDIVDGLSNLISYILGTQLMKLGKRFNITIENSRSK